MKKIILLAAACAALAACNLIDAEKQMPVEEYAFEKGQKVTLSVNAGYSESNTKAYSVVNSTTKKIDFKWEERDEIKVTVGSESETFTVSKLIDDGASAEFTGTMPGSGNSFDVQFPVDEPDLTEQYIYEEDGIGMSFNDMKATATNCEIGKSIVLEPQHSVVKLNFWGDDSYQNYAYIVIKDLNKENVSYSMKFLDFFYDFPTIGKSPDKATPISIIVPAGDIKMEITLYGEDDYSKTTPIYQWTTGNKKLIAGTVLDMPVKYIDEEGGLPDNMYTESNGGDYGVGIQIGDVIWAPVNCGYEPANGEYKGYTYGKLYQWGRKYGQGYKDDDYEDADYPGKSSGSQTMKKLTNTSDKLTSHPDGDTYNGEFYWNQTNWYQGGGTGAPAVDELWGASKTAYDPCPEGWRVPTLSELDKLAGGDGTGSAFIGGSGWDSTNKGYWFNGTSSPESGSGVFLPAAGSRDYDYGSASGRGYGSGYWSSSVDDDDAWYLAFRDRGAGMSSNYRAYGFSVRCVQE